MKPFLWAVVGAVTLAAGQSGLNLFLLALEEATGIDTSRHKNVR